MACDHYARSALPAWADSDGAASDADPAAGDGADSADWMTCSPSAANPNWIQAVESMEVRRNMLTQILFHLRCSGTRVSFFLVSFFILLRFFSLPLLIDLISNGQGGRAWARQIHRLLQRRGQIRLLQVASCG